MMDSDGRPPNRILYFGSSEHKTARTVSDDESGYVRETKQLYSIEVAYLLLTQQSRVQFLVFPRISHLMFSWKKSTG